MLNLINSVSYLIGVAVIASGIKKINNDATCEEDLRVKISVHIILSHKHLAVITIMWRISCIVFCPHYD